MKKILITGGAGYIGSKLITKLLSLNFRVTTIDRLKYSSKSLNHLFKYDNFIFISNCLFFVKDMNHNTKPVK